MISYLLVSFDIASEFDRETYACKSLACLSSPIELAGSFLQLDAFARWVALVRESSLLPIKHDYFKLVILEHDKLVHQEFCELSRFPVINTITKNSQGRLQLIKAAVS